MPTTLFALGDDLDAKWLEGVASGRGVRRRAILTTLLLEIEPTKVLDMEILMTAVDGSEVSKGVLSSNI